jgi:hypothetical protein
LDGDQDKIVREEVEDFSDFCRVNPQNSFTFVAKTLHGFIIGPHNFSDIGGVASMQCFAPKVYIKENDQIKPYRLLVTLGHKSIIALLFEVDFDFSY